MSIAATVAISPVDNLCQQLVVLPPRAFALREGMRCSGNDGHLEKQSLALRLGISPLRVPGKSEQVVKMRFVARSWPEKDIRDWSDIALNCRISRSSSSSSFILPKKLSIGALPLPMSPDCPGSRTAHRDPNDESVLLAASCFLSPSSAHPALLADAGSTSSSSLPDIGERSRHVQQSSHTIICSL